jgi:hypothetical protein
MYLHSYTPKFPIVFMSRTVMKVQHMEVSKSVFQREREEGIARHLDTHIHQYYISNSRR